MNALEYDDKENVTVVEFFTDNLDTDADEKAAAMSEALRQGRDPYILIHRILSGGNSPEEYVARFPADKFDFGQLQDYLAENYGGGDYRVRLYSSNRLVKAGNKLISIANRKKPVQSNQGGDLVALILQKMDQQNQMLMNILQSKPKESNNRAEFLDELIKMKAIFGGGGGGGIDSVRDALGLIKELGVPVGEVQKEDAGFSELLEKLAPLVIHAQPQQVQPNPINPQDQQRRQQMNMQQMQLRIGIGQLLTAAKKNADPGHWATTVLDMIDMETVKGFVSEGDPVEKMANIAPEVGSYREWFKLLAEHLKAQMGLPSSVSSEYDDDDLGIGAGNDKANL